MKTLPSSSLRATSPVRSHSSPGICGPRAHSSPSTIRTSVPAIGRPTEPGTVPVARSGPQIVAADSVRP